MRFAIFSDVHANLQAWEAVLADIQEQGVDTYVCLGDVVGYGPMPGPVLESVYQHTDNFVLGNHDAVVGGRINAATFNDHARYVIEWTAEQLGDDGAAFFAQVPLTLRGDKMFFTHGDAARPGNFDYVVKAEDARPSFQACKDGVIFFGHTHDPGVFACANTKGIIDKLPGTDVVLKKGRRYMVNPGSVGDPRSASDLRACYCIYDDTTRRVIFRKVEFDVESYRADLAASGLEMTPYFLRVIDAGSRRPEEEEELAIVQDHAEEIEVDESLVAQPRALVTSDSPMANRPKLHFGYSQPQRQAYPGVMPQTRRIQQVPIPPKSGMNWLWMCIIGILIGGGALMWVMLDFSNSKEDAEEEVAGELLAEDDGWEEADAPEFEEAEAEPAAAVTTGVSVPVFSLVDDGDDPFGRFKVELPDGVKLAPSWFGGKALDFSAGALPVTIESAEPIAGGGSLSVGAWVKVAGKESKDRYIFLRGGGTDAEIYLKIVSSKDRKFHGCVKFGGAALNPVAARSTSARRVDDGKWHFVLAVFDHKKQRARVYVDGKRRDAIPAVGELLPNDAPVVLGKGDFNGMIYGLRFYDKAIGTTEMQRIHALELPKKN